MGRAGKGLLACLAIGAVVAAVSVRNQPNQPPPPPKSEADQAVEQCEAAIAASYGAFSIRRAPAASDRWRDHGGKGGYDSLWTVAGKNAFGMPTENVIECEAGTKAKGSWTPPFLWNVTLNGDKLDPGTLDHPQHHSSRHRSKALSARD